MSRSRRDRSVFYRLSQLTNDPGGLTLVRNQATTLMASRIPERQTPGQWNNISRCCGATGAGEFSLGLFAATKDRSYLAFAERIAAYLNARAEPDANGIKWTQADRRIAPDHRPSSRPNRFNAGPSRRRVVPGALDQACRSQRSSTRLPDEPIWEKAVAAESQPATSSSFVLAIFTGHEVNPLGGLFLSPSIRSTAADHQPVTV
jgi:hypothetical protein